MPIEGSLPARYSRGIFDDIVAALKGLVKEGQNAIVLTRYMPAANEEYELRLPPNTKRFTVSLREGDAEFRMAFQPDKAGRAMDPYFRIPTGGTYWDENVNYTGKIYFACPVAGKTIQMICWQ